MLAFSAAPYFRKKKKNGKLYFLMAKSPSSERSSNFLLAEE